MKFLKRLSKEELRLRERRKDSVERVRQQRGFKEERRKRIRTLRPDLGPLGFLVRQFR